MKYRVGRNGREIGVWSVEEMAELRARGELLPGDFVWTEGMPEWRRLEEVLPAAGAPGEATVLPAAQAEVLPAGVAVRPPKPDNYLVWAILSTVLCCMPCGVPAIVFSAQVDSKWATGDYEGARESARKAKMWAWVSFWVWIAGMTLYVLFYAVLFASGAFLRH